MASLKMRNLAGVIVPDTPLIQRALAFAREHSTTMTYNHVVRSWLFAALLTSKQPIPEATLDTEAIAIAAILHDLAWDCIDHAEFVSDDKRFEVDCANGAREFLAKEAPDWDKHRVQVVWDAIALHSIASIAPYKETEVALTHLGIGGDILGVPGTGGKLSQQEIDSVLGEFPRLHLKEGLKTLMCGLCKRKPETTFDNFVGDIGESFLDGYKRRTFVQVMDMFMAE